MLTRAKYPAPVDSAFLPPLKIPERMFPWVDSLSTLKMLSSLIGLLPEYVELLKKHFDYK
jgi:hypothetical protein